MLELIQTSFEFEQHWLEAEYVDSISFLLINILVKHFCIAKECLITKTFEINLAHNLSAAMHESIQGGE